MIETLNLSLTAFSFEPSSSKGRVDDCEWCFSYYNVDVNCQRQAAKNMVFEFRALESNVNNYGL